MRCCVTGFVVPNISKDHDVFIFKENQSIFHGLIALKSEGNIILQTVMNHLASARTLKSSDVHKFFYQKQIRYVSAITITVIHLHEPHPTYFNR